MIKIILYISILFVATPAFAQQRPQYQHYIQNGMLVNPATTGLEGMLAARVGYRQQWTGIEGSPQTLYATFQVALNEFTNKKQKPKLPFLQSENKSVHGLGVSIFADEIGPFSQNEFTINYAYHLPIGPNHQLSAGLGLGLFSQRLNANMLEFANAGDPVTGNFIDPTNNPVISTGLWLSGPRYFTGVSYYQLWQTGNVNNNEITEPYRHWLLSVGYKLIETSTFEIAGSTLVKRLENLEWTADLNLTAGFYQRLWLGTSWRSNNEVIAFTRFALNKQFDIAYSYASGYGNNISAYSRGNHEISIGFRLSKDNSLFCPHHFW